MLPSHAAKHSKTKSNVNRRIGYQPVFMRKAWGIDFQPVIFKTTRSEARQKFRPASEQNAGRRYKDVLPIFVTSIPI